MPRPPARFHPGPFTYHQEIEVTIENLTNLGFGVARVNGWVVFIPHVIPGETVRARVFRNHKNYSEADLLEVLTPSPERTVPVCPLFGACGGCQYQHLSYPAQLDWKCRQVADLLARLGGLDFPVDPVVPSPKPYGYRSKITPHFQAPGPGGIGPIGFLKTGRRYELVDVPTCPIAHPAINDALPGVREAARRDHATRRKGATLLLRVGRDGITTDPKSTIIEQVGPLEFAFLAGDFFQNNPFLLPDFTAHAASEAAATGCRFLVDAYCGAGLFALTAASRFESVHGVEISASNVASARANAARNHIPNARFTAADAASIFAAIDFPPAGTAVLIDPPRAGCDAAFLSQLFAFAPRRVVYVSCNPATQMRDLAVFHSHGYTLRRVTPFDLFPQTRHLECVLTLDRSDHF